MQADDGIRAGIVIGEEGIDSEELIARFARELDEQGVRVGGVYQRTSESEGRRRMELVDLHSGEVIPLSQDLGRDAESCILDPDGLSRGSVAVQHARADGVALIVVNKFSAQEAAGKGMADELFAAMAEGVPVLTAVSRKHLDAWTRLSGGLGTLLRPRIEDLRRWWADAGG